MRSSKYRLEALVSLRDRRVDRGADDLARAARALEGAERTRAAAEHAQAEHRAAAAGLRGAERAALASGELRVADLAAGEAWGVRVESENRVLQGRVDAARAEEAKTLADERKARAELADRKVDADVVHKDRARFDELQRRATEARDDEASFEAWRPKR
jgi:hypothetical protein